MDIIRNDLIYHTSTVSDGNMSFKFGVEKSVLNNRKKFLHKIQVPTNKCIGIDLMHGTGIVFVTKDDVSELGIKTFEGDALITDVRGVLFLMLTADCLPIVFMIPQSQ